MDELWLYRAEDGSEQGPVEVAELRVLWRDGAVSATTLARRPDSDDDWAPVSALPALEAKLTAERRRASSAARGRRSSAFLAPMEAAALAPPASMSSSSSMAPVAESESSSSSSEEEEDDDDPDGDRDGSEWVWARDPVSVYVPVKVLQRDVSTGELTVQTAKKQLMTLSPDDVAWPIRDVAALDKQTPDLVAMVDVNDATILTVLKHRFRADTIYTNIGDILVAVNPFKAIAGLYAPEMVTRYVEGMARRSEELEPHVYVVANAAYSTMMEEESDQSILISGESGAGKTESTKQCLQFLSTVAGGAGETGSSSDGDVAARMLAANPILEAFGNAKTLRNNNSSRFGKYMAVRFNHHGKITGCSVSSYLLEKSRIVTQMPSERNYHSFYQLCAGVTDQQRAHLELTAPEEYVYLSQSGCVSIPGVDDAEDFVETDQALQQLGFSDSERQSLFEVTAAVLHLGNIRFVSEGEGSRLAGGAEVSLAARLLQVPAEALTARLVHRSMDIRGETVTLDLNPDQAADGRNALAKGLYGKMFDWLVRRVNDAMAGSTTTETTQIGILDIFGFEIFENNSFEQLCINYCNEKLQQEFNEHTFRAEQATYRDEGVDFEQIHYIDNQPVLDLLEKKPAGVLPLLDDEIVVPRASDETFLKKLQSAQKDHEKFATPRGAASLTSFVVRHYAGEVMYAVAGFLDKNKDRLFDDLAELMRGSHSDFIRALFPSDDAANAGASRRGRQPTQGLQFKRQLDSLLVTIRATYPHYIRCIKPNAQKVAEVFDSQLILQQLQYSGVFEAVTIRKSGFPFRLDHAEFFRRFRLLAPDAVPVQPADVAAGCRQLVRALGADNAALGECRVGRTMVLWRSEQHVHLEAGRAVIWRRACQRTARFIRGCLTRMMVEQIRAAKPVLEAALRTREIAALEAALGDPAVAAAMGKFKIREAYQAEALVHRLREERRLRRELADVVHTDPDLNFDQFHAIMTAADELGLTPADEPLLEQARAMYATVAERRLAKKGLRDAVAAADVELLHAALEIVAKLKQSYGEFCTVEEAEARTMMVRIQRETQLVSALRSTVEAGALRRRGNRLLAEEGAVAALEAAIAEVRRADVCTAEGRRCVAVGDLALALRRAVAAAPDESVDCRWHEVARVLDESCGDGAAVFEELLSEVALVREELAVRDAACDVAQKLAYAVQALDEDWLVFALDQAERMQLVELGSEELQDQIALGQQTLRYLAATKAALRDAVQKSHMVKLERAIKMADAISYESSLVSRARVLHLKGQKLVAEASAAIRRMDKQQMWRCLEQATAMQLESPEVTAIREVLALPQHEFLHRLLKAALELHDMDLLVAATTDLKANFLRSCEGVFHWRSFARLRREADFGHVLGEFSDSTARGMLVFTRESIHVSLTLLPPSLSKLAVTMFNYVLGVQGLRRYSHPAVLAADVLRMGVQHAALRDELYVALMKQLSGVPPGTDEAVSSRALALLKLATMAFAPSTQLENYLETFLRGMGLDSHVESLHRTIYQDTPQMVEAVTIEGML